MVQFASYLRRVLSKTRLIFPRINGPIVHVSKIQVYLYDDVFQKEKVFHLDRSQWLSLINSAHLHWDLQNE